MFVLIKVKACGVDADALEEVRSMMEEKEERGQIRGATEALIDALHRARNDKDYTNDVTKSL